MRREKKLVIAITLILIFPIFISLNRATASTIEAESKTVMVGESFTLNITCYPTEPIKAWELKVDFDNSLLRANSVSEGNFFNAYWTFFVPGIIENENGTIKNIYDLIIWDGNVSSPGTLVSINFTAVSEGNSIIELYGVGITNETTYLSCDVNSGSVDIFGESGPDPPPAPPAPPIDPPAENTEQNDSPSLSLNDVVVVMAIILTMLWSLWIYIR